MSEVRVRDRRFRPDRPLLRRECRLCWRTIEIDAAHIELSNQLAFARCDHCGGSFPIRHSDVDAVVGTDSATA